MGLFLVQSQNPLLPALQNLVGDAVVVQQSPIRLVLGSGLPLEPFCGWQWQGSEVLCVHKGCPSSYPDLYVVGVKACAPGPQLVLVLWETGREMACELCNNHPKACTGRLGFIDRLLEIEWSNAPEIELTLIPLHDHM